MKKYSSPIAGAVILITVTTILSRGIGFIREVVFADTFGLNRDFEIYLVAAVLPVLINSAIYYLAQNYFIPLYNKSLSPDERRSLLKNQFWLFFLLGALLSIILYLSRAIILKLYFGTSDVDEASNIFLVYILSFPLNAGYSILAAYLQAELKFRHPAISQLFLNLPIIALVLFFHKSLMILSIPVGYLAGSILQLVYLILIVGPGMLSLQLKSSLKDITKGLTGSLTIVILIEIINQLHPFIDRYFYDQVEPGGIASLNYASVLFGLPVTIFSFTIATVIFPVLSKYINSDTPELTGIYFSKSLQILTAVFIPIAFIYFFDGDLIIRVIYQRGKFQISDTNMTYFVLKMYSLSLVFYAGYALINKMVFSMGLLKQLLIISAAVIILKIILNAYFVGIMQQNGLALSSSLNFILLSVSCYFLVSLRLKPEHKYTFIKQFILFGVTAGLAYYLSIEFVKLNNISGIINNILQIIMFLIVYTLSIRFLKLTNKSLLSLK